MSEGTMYVPRHYQMDPELDDLLFDGSEIKVGMHILIADSHMRADPGMAEMVSTEAPDSMDCLVDQLNEVNRWCEVLRVECAPGGMFGGGQVAFLGRYPDGQVRKRMYSTAYAWLVRKFSIPSSPDTEA